MDGEDSGAKLADNERLRLFFKFIAVLVDPSDNDRDLNHGSRASSQYVPLSLSCHRRRTVFSTSHKNLVSPSNGSAHKSRKPFQAKCIESNCSIYIQSDFSEEFEVCE